MENLKPCPFCGSEAEIIKVGIQFKIRCKKWACEASNIKFDSLNMAIETWNTRTSGWISVDDALPESDCECLCYSKNILSGETCLDVFRFVYIANTFCRRFGIEVTHWMLPPNAPEVRYG